jgi:hypothetical protein
MTVAPYKNFIVEADKSDAKLLKLYVSPKFESILHKIMKSADNYAKTVATRIINIDKGSDENLFSLSYVDISKDKDDEVTFLPAGRAYYKMGWTNQEEANRVPPTPDSEFWTINGRQSLRIGKFVNTLFDDFSDKSIDSFVNAFKAEIAATQIYNRFKLVSGEDIRYWYAGSNYYNDPSSGGGQLGGSCMRYDGKITGERDRNCQPYFDIYCKNPERCKMLILTHQTDKLLGRAIVWGPLRKPTDKIFMDRIYTVRQSDVELFKKYAMDQGWIYKYNQDAHDFSYMENGSRIQKSLAVALTPKDFKTYPFMDTLKYYNPTTGRLGSDPGNPVEGTRRLRLEQQGGQTQRVD